VLTEHQVNKCGMEVVTDILSRYPGTRQGREYRFSTGIDRIRDSVPREHGRSPERAHSRSLTETLVGLTGLSCCFSPD
jgi:hypothetical protein